MLVTCYVDASFAPHTGGAWAVWLRSEKGRIVRSGACPDYVRDSNTAELAAIWAGIWLTLQAWPDSTAILVCSDSQGALGMASGKLQPRDQGAQRVRSKILDALRRARVRLIPRWVRGHQPQSAGVAAYLNGQCDKLAGRRRRGDRRCPQTRQDGPAATVETREPVGRPTSAVSLADAVEDPSARRVVRSVRVSVRSSSPTVPY